MKMKRAEQATTTTKKRKNEYDAREKGPCTRASPSDPTGVL